MLAELVAWRRWALDENEEDDGATPSSWVWNARSANAPLGWWYSADGLAAPLLSSGKSERNSARVVLASAIVCVSQLIVRPSSGDTTQHSYEERQVSLVKRTEEASRRVTMGTSTAGTRHPSAPDHHRHHAVTGFIRTLTSFGFPTFHLFSRLVRRWDGGGKRRAAPQNPFPRRQ